MHPSQISPNNKLYKRTPLRDNTPRVKPCIQNHNLAIAETPLTAPTQIKKKLETLRLLTSVGFLG